MKRYLFTLALIATTAFGVYTSRADDTNAMAAAAATNAPAAAPTPASTNAPSMEQRMESIEAYFQNGDPTATYKDTNGNRTVNFSLAGNIINTNLSNSIG